MTDKDMVVDDGTDGDGGSPSQPSSQATSRPSPIDVGALESALQEIKALKGEVNALKSDKDKGVARVAKEVQGLSEQFKRYEQLRSKDSRQKMQNARWRLTIFSLRDGRRSAGSDVSHDTHGWHRSECDWR